MHKYNNELFTKKDISLTVPPINLQESKHYKENISYIQQKKIDFSGNIIKRQIFYHRNKINRKQIKSLTNIFKRSKELLHKLLFKNFYLNYTIDDIDNNEINYTKILKNETTLTTLVNLYNTIKTRKIKVLKYKIFNKTKIFNIVTRNAPNVYVQDEDTTTIKRNKLYKIQYPGYPKLFNKFQKKLRKKLLIQRTRRKLKFIILQQTLALHTFMGTKEITYADLVKRNNCYLAKFLYQYKLRMKAKKKTGFKEKKLMKRPFKISKMNQARFNRLESAEYTLWLEKMQTQLLEASHQS